MEKEILAYLHGEKNAVRGEFILSREKTDRSEYVYVSVPDTEQSIPIYKGWAKPIKRDYGGLATVKTIEAGEAKPPKHTGGKRPYIMVMQDKGEIIDKLSLNASGLLLKLFSGGYIEWGTGRVIDRRSKKSMTVKMMCAKFGIKLIDIKPILKEVSSSKVMTFDKSKRAYFVNQSLAQKGGGQCEDKV